MSVSQQLVVRWLECAAAGAVLLAAASIAVRCVRQPADRIPLILIGFLAASLVPVLGGLALVPAWHLGIVASAAPEQASPSGSSMTAPPTGLIPGAAPAAESVTRIAASRTPPSDFATTGGSPMRAAKPSRDRDLWTWAAVGLVLAHVIAVLWLIVESIIGMWRLRRISALALPSTDEVQKLWAAVTKDRGDHVRLVVSADVATPLAYGWFRPTVVLPRDVAAGDPTTLRFCLAHEWSHIERADLRGWRLTWLCQFLLWFQPMFWKLRRELRVCQDFLADNRATGEGRNAIEYSEVLLGFAKQRVGRPVAGAIAFLDQSSQLSRRIKMLLTSPMSLRSQSPRAFCFMAGLLSLLGAALISGVRLDSARADEAAKPIQSAEKGPGTAKPAAGEADKQETLHYTGVVLDKETGKGIPDAAVIVRRSKLTSEENSIIEESRHTTDAEGKYAFVIPPEQVAVSHLYIELDVMHDDYAARKGFGYALSMIRKNEGLGERPFFEKVELRPAEPVTGTVTSPEGKLLAGIKVQGYSKSNATDFRDYGSFTDTVTDEAGRFRLPLVKGGVGVFWVLPTEYASTSRDVNKERGDVGEIRLRPGVRVSGRVISAEGKPVSNIPVNIDYAGGGNETVNNLPVASSIRRSALTDSDGNFAFDPLPSGDYRVIPQEHRSDPIIRDRTRHEIPGVFLPIKVKLQEGVAAAPVEIQASPHVIFNAQVYDSKGAKTRGHEIMLFGRMDGEYWFGQGRPNSEGTVSLRVPHGLQQVQVQLMTNEHGALRFRRGKGRELENRQLQIELGTLNEDVEGFEVIRYKAPIVLVSAVDEDQKPVQDFKVAAAYPWGKQEYILDGEQRSDLSFEHQNDGKYRTSQMLPDEDVKFTVTAAGYETATETIRLAEGETKDLLVTLKKAAEAAKADAKSE